MKLCVILPTHNPHCGRLERTIASLRLQTLPMQDWQLLLIDNASSPAIVAKAMTSWHPNGRVVRESSLGLTHARMRGFREASASICVLADDDNVLAVDYLNTAVELFSKYEGVGLLGGRSIPEYQGSLPPWFEEIHGPLAIVDHGDDEVITRAQHFAQSRCFPATAPVGAGMCIRREAAIAWTNEVNESTARQSLDRRGNSLASGGDNDIVLTAMKHGWDVGYFPQLSLTHIMPASRLTAEYHARLIEASNRTWVVTLGLHGISPWAPIAPWTLGVRKLRAALRFKPWSGEAAFLKWKAACGQLAGRSELWKLQGVKPESATSATIV